MKSSFLRPSFLGVSAMLIATCGYAAARVSPQTAQADPPAATSANTAGAQSMQLVSANALLVYSLDSKSAAQGQAVTAKLTGNVKTAEGMKLDKGTVLMGKVEQVERSNDKGPSRLSIVLDQARLKDGRTIPVKATLLGAYPANTGDLYGSGASPVAEQSHFISDKQQVDQEAGTLGPVSLHSAVQSDTSGTFVSKNHDIKLKRGTQLQIAIGTVAAG